jgi:predicted transcriptional regulator
MQRLATEQAANCCSEVADALERSPDGTQKATLSFTFHKTTDAVLADANWSYSKTVKGEPSTDSEPCPDPNQPSLPIE